MYVYRTHVFPTCSFTVFFSSMLLFVALYVIQVQLRFVYKKKLHVYGGSAGVPGGLCNPGCDRLSWYQSLALGRWDLVNPKLVNHRETGRERRDLMRKSMIDCFNSS